MKLEPFINWLVISLVTTTEKVEECQCAFFPSLVHELWYRYIVRRSLCQGTVCWGGQTYGHDVTQNDWVSRRFLISFDQQLTQICGFGVCLVSEFQARKMLVMLNPAFSTTAWYVKPGWPVGENRPGSEVWPWELWVSDPQEETDSFFLGGFHEWRLMPKFLTGRLMVSDGFYMFSFFLFLNNSKLFFIFKLGCRSFTRFGRLVSSCFFHFDSGSSAFLKMCRDVSSHRTQHSQPFQTSKDHSVSSRMTSARKFQQQQLRADHKISVASGWRIWWSRSINDNSQGKFIQVSLFTNEETSILNALNDHKPFVQPVFSLLFSILLMKGIRWSFLLQGFKDFPFFGKTSDSRSDVERRGGTQRSLWWERHR